MLVLRKIEKRDNIIEADYYPENKPAKGHIKIDLGTNEVISLEEPEGYGNSGLLHAKRALIKMAVLETLPEERFVMWY